MPRLLISVYFLKRCYVADIDENFSQLLVAFRPCIPLWLDKIQKWKLKNKHQLLDLRNLITLKIGDSSKSRNLSPAKYSFSKFAKSKSRENK